MKAEIWSGDRYAKAEDWGRAIRAVMGAVPEIVIHGDCEGIDRIARDIARELGGTLIPMPYVSAMGRAGGPFRNGKMLVALQALGAVGYRIRVVACHDNLTQSKGTKDMIEQAAAAGVPVRIVRSDGNMYPVDSVDLNVKRGT